MPGSKRKAVSLETKVAVICAVENGKRQEELCRDYGLPKSTAATIVGNKKKIMTAFEQNKLKPEKMRMRGSDYQQLEDVILKWYQMVRANNLPVSGPIMHTKALDFASQMNIKDFKASQGWLDKFKKRNNISFYTVMAGECASLSARKQWIHFNRTSSQSSSRIMK